MKLKHITFTGIDARTDIGSLCEIQEQYPLVEFGVLTSYHWYENGNRYLNPRLFRNLTRAHLNLSLHLCGMAAHDAACGLWGEISYLSWGKYRYFRRIQLNVANREDNPETVWVSPWPHEIIVQQKDIEHLELFEASKKNWPDYCCSLSVLLDASGGRGIDVGIKIFPSDRKVGYAGGINPDNVAEKLSYLFENVKGDFWIDMESGVRTNDWFDIDKVRRVLEICQPIIERYRRSER